MADRKHKTDYENAVWKVITSHMLEQYGKELEEKYKDTEDVTPSPEAAEKFEKALNRAYRKGKILSFCTRISKFGKYAVTVCAAFIVVFAVSVISVDAFRLRFLEWLFNIHESHSSINISNDNNSYSNMVHVDYMPQGYDLISYTNDGDIIEICYSNNITSIKIYVYLDHFSFNTDIEDTLSEEVYINSSKGQYQKKELTSDLIWYDDQNSYWISTNNLSISKDEIVKIAQSLN